ncbi:MAG: heavy metal translocating P-type ATPase [Desulforhabdus sp.]|jgi:Cd2+/Zn2+-exporting ATPase|nr:heavy metal translocating P-type ATPase [Desulforhabdus sp.]
MTHKKAFRIEGMDCGEEIAVLKKEIGPLVGGELNLSFDLLNRKMTVSTASAAINERQIREAVASTGMQAVPWTESCATETCPVEEGIWQRNYRFVLCAVSGIFMIVGLVIQATHQGDIIAVLAETGGKEPATPLAAILFYVGAIISGGWYIAPKAFFAARKLRPDMNLLMSIAVVGAVAIGYWLEAASVTFLFALALLLESWSVGHARKAIKALIDITPIMARCICPVDGEIEEKPVEAVPIGTTVIVRPGEKIPLDGVVTNGETSVNQAPITGEAMPVSKKPGDEVFAGTINGEGSIKLRSTKSARDTTLANIIHMVEEAQSRRAPTEQWVDRFARYYTPTMIILAVLLALVPPLVLSGGWMHWFYQALVILVIACPCSLVISTPVSIVAGLTSAARHGVLIKGGIHLEAPSRLKVMAFDKTGTLTYGRPVVQKVIPLNNHSEAGLLARAAALEAHSSHPMARAVLSYVEAMGIEYKPADNFTIIPGEGAQGIIDNKSYWIGSHRMLDRLGEESPQLHDLATQLEDAGHSLVTMWCEDHVCGLISIADEVRPETRTVLESLRRSGIERIVMITGDNRRAAEEVAALTGVDEFYANLLPENKVAAIGKLRQEIGHVAMVGDGVNDAPAMAESSLAIAMGAMGTDAAIETADIALMADDLSRLPWLISHSHKTMRTIKQNIIFSLSIKAVFIGLALIGLATLWGAIAADMGASLLVIFNGLRLLKSH